MSFRSLLVGFNLFKTFLITYINVILKPPLPVILKEHSTEESCFPNTLISFTNFWMIMNSVGATIRRPLISEELNKLP